MKALLVGVGADSEAIVARALGEHGHDQVVTTKGVRALDLIRKSAPPLVIVHDPLVDMTVVEFCRRARASPEGEAAIILVITSRLDDLQSYLDAGATDLHITSLGPDALEIRLHIAQRLVREHARLRDRELRFRRLFESGVAGITISDLDGHLKEANDAFLQMLGYTREEMAQGKVTWDLISPLDRLVSDTEDRLRLRSETFLPLRERDYVHKEGRRVAALEGSATLAGTTECISYVADISVREREVDALRASVAQYRALFERAPIAKFLYDHETLRFLAVNDAAIETYGYSRAEFLRMTFDEIRKKDVPGVLQISGAPSLAMGPGGAGPGPMKHKKKDGTVIDVETTVQDFALGSRPCGLAVAVDVTQRNRLEAQLRQSQKLEAIGSLAAGIAHDFNNILSVILSYAEVLASDLEPGDPMRSDLDEISAAGNRAADLTRQLLIFSRQQILQPKVMDLAETVGALAKMLRRLVGEDVELCVVNGPALGSVKADPGQVEQVLMNLVVNARDAMPSGGKLTIETANVELDARYARAHAGVTPGSYVMLAVTDTGSGMDAATRERIFEPFFTTKAKGKGTGLGLSMVFGIVQQSGGSLQVDTELGVGTTFRVRLPRVPPAREVAIGAALEARTHRGSETILLVEDEAAVRAVIRRILERNGYSVLEAQSGGDALVLSEQHKGPIDVLLTDVVMPRMSGRELVERLRPQRPETKVFYISGYTDDSILRQGILSHDFAFLQKPITPETLIRKLREVIDSAPSSWSERSPPDAPDARRSAQLRSADPER